MARLNTARESNGPDRFNLSPGCNKHHAGVRTGISDYCCCCDPCNYVRKVESAERPEDRLCCRCIPRLILVKFKADETSGTGTAPTGTGTGTGSQSLCCRDAIVPMVAQVTTRNTETVVEYTGTIVGHSVLVRLSNGPAEIQENPEDYPCQWTISIPSLGVFEEIEIDHHIVTCLGVPSISVSNVVAFENCVGTISLANYQTVKLPFQSKAPTSSAPSLTVSYPEIPGEAPTRFSCGSCTTLPRYLCVTKKHNRVNRIKSPNIAWEIEWWKEFTWEEGFVPYLSRLGTGTGTLGTGTVGTGTNSFEAEWVIGRWTYNPNPDATPAEFTQSIFLVQSLDGLCFLQPDFEDPSAIDGEDETYQRVRLPADCGCEFKILNVRPINDPFPPEVPGEPIADDLIGIDIRGGKCGCWGYHCGQRRCVPKYLCGLLFVNNVLYRDLLFTWSNASKSWTTSGGKDIDGNPVDISIEVRLTSGPDGKCQLETSYEGFDIDPVTIDDTTTVLSALIEAYANPVGTGTGTSPIETSSYFNLTLNTSFEGECELLLPCTLATPCASECRSHPEILHLRLHGYSTPSDIPPPPVTGECTTEIELAYWQTVSVSGTGILIACGYRGYKLVESYYSDSLTSTTGIRTYLISATLSLGQLRITRQVVGPSTEAPYTETVLFPSQSCDPYYAYKLTSASLRNCFFGDISIIWHRWEAEITE